METLHHLRTSLLLSFRYLPILLVPFLGLLAGAFSNPAMLALFLGHCFAVPIGTLFLRLLPFPGRIPWNDVGNLYPVHPNQITSTNQPTVTTYWMGHIVFFFTYMFINAYDIYVLPVHKEASEWMTTNRKTKILTVLAVLCIVFIALVYTRYATTGSESILGIVVAFAGLGTASYGWYILSQRCGIQHGDMFGIVTQIVPTSITNDDTPMTCVYAPQP